jgi:hypothetical protein
MSGNVTVKPTGTLKNGSVVRGIRLPLPLRGERAQDWLQSLAIIICDHLNNLYRQDLVLAYLGDDIEVEKVRIEQRKREYGLYFRRVVGSLFSDERSKSPTEVALLTRIWKWATVRCTTGSLGEIVRCLDGFPRRRFRIREGGEVITVGVAYIDMYLSKLSRRLQWTDDPDKSDMKLKPSLLLQRDSSSPEMYQLTLRIHTTLLYLMSWVRKNISKESRLEWIGGLLELSCIVHLL